jgi:hypothetical protein
VVKNKSDYFEKISTVLNSEAYDLLKEGPTATIARKIQSNSYTNKTSFTPNEKRKLAAWHNTQLLLYRLLKIHKT